MINGRSSVRPGGSTESPGRAPLGDELLAFAFVCLWSVMPTLALGAAALGGWFLLPRLASLLLVGLAACGWVLSARSQWRWFRGVFLRRALPMKLRQVGLVNRVGQTPAIQRVTWVGGVVRIRFATRAGHTSEMFEARRSELAAALGAVDLEVTHIGRSVQVTAVRRSAHGLQQVQSW